MIIDTHSHIYAEQFDEDRTEMLQRSKEKGVGKILMPNIDGESIEGMMQLKAQYPEFCYAMMGLHPCSVKPDSYQDELTNVYELLKSNTSDFVAVGEIGIDLYWDKSKLEIQKEAFAKQIEWSIEFDLPFAIHARDSFQEIFEVMDSFDSSIIRGVFHCFSGNNEVLSTIISKYPNFYFGLGGVSTFKNSGMDMVIPNIPDDKMLLETDAPYLAPTPYRGKRNEPSYIIEIAQKVADFKQMSLDRLSEITTINAKQLFELL